MLYWWDFSLGSFAKHDFLILFQKDLHLQIPRRATAQGMQKAYKLYVIKIHCDRI